MRSSLTQGDRAPLLDSSSKNSHRTAFSRYGTTVTDGQPATNLVLKDPSKQPKANGDDRSVPLGLELGYQNLLEDLRSSLPPLPQVPITFHNLSYTMYLHKTHRDIPNVAKAWLQTLKWLWPPQIYRSLVERVKHRSDMETFHVLQDLNGEIPPGRMQLVLAPPGHGKTSFMCALADRLNSGYQEGQIRYAGKTKEELGASVQKLVAYIDQVDAHMPQLTVRETLQFAKDSLVADESLLDNERAKELSQWRVEQIISILGLEECANTPVGNHLVRGISGGQKKRVTVGQMLVSNARALLLDEISTGLDSAVTLDIFKYIKAWCKVTNGTALASLLQAPRDVYALFDDILLLQEGHIIYHGPKEEVFTFLKTLGIVGPGDMDPADFLVKFVTDPYKIWHESKSDKNEVVKPDLRSEVIASKWREYCHATRMKEQYHPSLNASDSLELDHPFLREQYCQTYAKSSLQLLQYNCSRQTKLLLRNLRFIGSRIIQALFIGIVLGTLFWNLDKSQTQMKIGLLMFSAIFLSFGNMSEVPIAIENRKVVQQQDKARFYPIWTYTVSVLIVHLPLAMLETLIVGALLYFMTGLASDAGRFLFFYLCTLTMNLAMGALFRAIAYASPKMEVAQTFTGPLTGVMLLFGGFLITRKNIPKYLRFMYWLSPFSWITRSLMQNEFYSNEYAPEEGKFNLELYQIPTEHFYKWLGVGVLLCYFVISVALIIAVLKYRSIQINVGSTRKRIDGDMSDNQTTESLNISTSMTFEPVTLTFRDIEYDIQISRGNWRKLLQGISGVAKPGIITALMGASGAGKTTLMDTIAGRKSFGKVKGDIFLNGYPKEKETFSRLVGYVEQEDAHMPYCTVFESVYFAAKLRLPATINPGIRRQFVEEVICLLELDNLHDRLVGEPGADDGGLSPGERKRLTIAVELVANPSILFLDEPTTGLDSREALTVMRVIRRITSTGRTVICTVHQPSAEIFNMFDSMLLLKSGGYSVYSGPIGENGRHLREFLESAGAPPCAEDTNPADWMLDVLGVGTDFQDIENLNTKVDFAAAYRNSSLKQRNDEEVGKHCTPTPNAPLPQFRHVFARSYTDQFIIVMRRTAMTYWRNSPYNWTRNFILILMSFLFGLLFLNIVDDAHDQAGVLSMISLMLTTGAFSGTVCYGVILPVMLKERAIYYREVSSNMYSSYVYSTAQGLIEIPYVFVMTISFATVYYFMAGFKADAGIYFEYMLVQYLLCQVMTYLGMFFAALFPNVEVAQIFGSILVTLFFLFGQVFVPKPEIPHGWMWMNTIDPVAYTTRAMAALQFYCEGENCPKMNIIDPTTGEFISQYEYAKDVYGFSYDKRWHYIGYLFIFLVVFRVAGILSLRFVNHMKK